MVKEWREDENYSHGFLIPFISGFIVWRKWPEIINLEKKPNSFGLLFFIFGLSLFILGYVGSEFFLQRFSIIVVIFGLILWNLGWLYAKLLVFPVFFLVFMIPLPYILYDSIAFPLKILASKLATTSLSILQIPIFREGNIIHLTSGTLQVEDVCSGIRSLVSLLALTTIYSYVAQKGFLSRLILVASAIPIAVLLNSLRVSITGVMAVYYGDRVAEGFFHEFSGWLIFILAFVLIYFVNKFISYLFKLIKKND
jgi:exosortase